MTPFSVPISLKNEEFATLQTKYIIPKNITFLHKTVTKKSHKGAANGKEHAL